VDVGRSLTAPGSKGQRQKLQPLYGPLVSKYQSTKDTETAKVRVKISYDDIVKGGNISPQILNLDTRRRQMVTFSPLANVLPTPKGKTSLYHLIDCALQLVRPLLGREKSLTPTENIAISGRSTPWADHRTRNCDNKYKMQ